MKQEEKELMSCGKVKYKDKLAAMVALVRCKGKHNNAWKRQEKRVYYCNECKAWHLTKK